MREVSCGAAAGDQAAGRTSEGCYAHTIPDSAAKQAERNARTCKQSKVYFTGDFLVAAAFVKSWVE